MHFHKGAIAKLIKKLEIAGYIKRTLDCEDKRVQRLYLDEKGKENISTIFSIENEWSNILANSLTSKEINTLETLLDKIIQNITRTDIL